MRKAIFGAAAMTILIASCGSKTDANEKNFSAAIEQYLDKKGGLCLNVTRWPVDIDAMELRLQKTLPTATAGRMAALEAVGLVEGTEIEIEATGFDGKPNGRMFKVRRYTMTDAAKPFARTEEVERFGGKGKIRETRTDLCWGKKVLHKVVKWEGPRTFGDYQEALVQYQYKIDGLAEWAKKPELLVAFPSIGRMVDDHVKKEQHVVKLTSLGWEAAGLDN